MLKWTFATISACICWVGIGTFTEPEFIKPDWPIIEARAISQKVTNGTAFEHGFLKLEPGQELVLPDGAVIEEHDGDEILFFLTKTMHCNGHPPHPMRIAEARHNLGIAWKSVDENDTLVISTFGEWSNKGGTAAVKLLILVPGNLQYRRDNGLEGESSQASHKMDFNDPNLEKCYWYSGIGPAEGWNRIPTRLNFNRFVAPE